MKKLLTKLFGLTLVAVLLFSFGCNVKSAEKTTVNVYAPDGAPALSIAKFIYDNENFGYNDVDFNYNVVASSNIGAMMIQGKGDIIIMPVNASSKIYGSNKNDAYKMASVVTHGNLYIMSKNVSDLSGLVGNVVGVIGQGLVPDLTFRSILKKNNIDFEISESPVNGKIAVRYFSDASTLLPMLKQGVISNGLLPEPAATKLTSLAFDVSWNRLNVQELYDNETKSYPQAVVMVKESLIKKYPDLVGKIASKFGGNVEWIKKNVAVAVDSVNGKLAEGVTPSLSAGVITEKVVDNCNIYWQSSLDAKRQVAEYINSLIEIDGASAKAVGDDYFM